MHGPCLGGASNDHIVDRRASAPNAGSASAINIGTPGEDDLFCRRESDVPTHNRATSTRGLVLHERKHLGESLSRQQNRAAAHIDASALSASPGLWGTACRVRLGPPRWRHQHNSPKGKMCHEGGSHRSEPGLRSVRWQS